ncbi:hypothetical protein NOMA109596_18920 [Nocardioides marinus]|uniref:Peptidoglycan binding domain-containing protein n=1 Tax=Nocardioides marinus TaxID=374514 RepID=A0A7Y9YAU3_9ACTN|nr:hypothetical protein [Nocardioides marinus]NYI08766.1 hypothetical protein [Nocardioides marinus]
MTPHAPATVHRTALAVSTALITALPVLAVSGAPAGAAARSDAASSASATTDALAARAGKKKGTQKYHHRAKVGSQVLRAIVLDQTPGIEGGKVVDLRVGRAAANINTRKENTAVSTSKTLGGRGLADNDLSGLLTALVAKVGPAKGKEAVPSQTLVPVPAEPLLSLGVSTGDTMARWNGPKKCVPGRKAVTSSTSSTADLAVLPSVIPGFGSLLGLDGTVSAIQKTSYLPKKKKAGLKAVATTALADIGLFGDMVNVEVVADPKMVAVATGRPGKAKITYTPAVLEITGPDGSPVPIPTDGAPAEIGIPANPLLGLTIQFPGIISEKVTDNGRMAKAKSVTLRLVLSLAGQVIADVAVAPLQTKVKVPKGGITC